MNRWKNKKFIGFTLIELLAVIVIIVVLTSILLPALRTARERAKEVGCSNNMKQLGIIHMTYTSDFCDWFVPGLDQSLPSLQQSWNFRLRYFDYINARKDQFWDNAPVLRCPTTTDEMLLTSGGTIKRAYCYGINWNLTGYITSSGVFSSNVLRSHKAGQVRYPAQCILLGDVVGVCYGWNQSYLEQGQGYAFGDPHRASSNILWVDGHVNTEHCAQLKFKCSSSSNAPNWAANGQDVSQ